MKQNKNLILSLESSGSACGIALYDGAEELAVYEIRGKNLHDKLMAARVESLLEDAGIKITDLSAVAVSAGPGSFTGLRIAGSIAKGICYGDTIKLISVPTMEAIARAAARSLELCPPERIVCLVGSTRGECFKQDFNSKGLPISEISERNTEEVLKEIFERDTLVGPGSPQGKFRELSVRFIAQFAAEIYEKRQFTSSGDYAPLYVQDFKLRTVAK